MNSPWESYDAGDRLRVAIRAAIEEATGESLSMNDPLPDTLFAAAQAQGLSPHELRMFISDQPKPDWSIATLARWAARWRAAEAAPQSQQAKIESDPRGDYNALASMRRRPTR